MKRRKRLYKLLPLILVSTILLILIRFILHQFLADVSLFSNYISPIEKDLQIITQLNDINSHIPSKGKMVFYALVIGGIVSVSLIYLFRYLLRRQDVVPLYFSVAGIFLGLRLSFTKETLFMNLLFDFSPGAIVLADMVTGMGALLFFMFFYGHEFINTKYKKYMNYLVSIVLIYGAVLLTFPLQIVLDTFVLYQFISFLIMLYILVFTIISFTENRKGSTVNLVGFFILFTVSWNDFLHYSDKLTTNEFIIIGVFIYFVLLAIHLAIKLVATFEEVKELTEELQELNISLEEKVKRRTNKLWEANETLQRSKEARKRLLTSVSHELNTPLAFIQGYVKAMLDEVVPKEDTSYLRAIYDDTVMMSILIDDLQELSIIELGQVTFQLRLINIPVFMEQLHREIEQAFKQKQINFNNQLRIDSNLNSEIAYIDPVRIKQVVMNLMVNAEKFTPEGGKVTLDVFLTNKGEKQLAIISVIDTGIGIKESDIPYLFERLYRVKEGLEQERKGSGLGLSIAREIVEFHGGEMGVESTYGRGSKFYFTLPLKGAINNHEDEGESVSG